MCDRDSSQTLGSSLTKSCTKVFSYITVEFVSGQNRFNSFLMAAYLNIPILKQNVLNGYFYTPKLIIWQKIKESYFISNGESYSLKLFTILKISRLIIIHTRLFELVLIFKSRVSKRFKIFIFANF